MKKALKIISIIMCAILCISVVFTGCSNKIRTATLSDYFSKGETIWYVVHSDDKASISKDSKVTGIMVFYDDGTYIGIGVDETLGAIENMEDSEIIEMVKQKSSEEIAEETDTFLNEIKEKLCPMYSVEEWEKMLKEFFDHHYDSFKPNSEHPFSSNYIQYLIDWDEKLKFDNSILGDKCEEIIVNNVLDCYSTQDYKATAKNICNELTQCIESDELYKEGVAKIQELAKNPVFKYKLVVNTDGTGNNVQDESIVMQYLSSGYTEMSIKSEALKLFTYVDKESEYYTMCHEIYDSYYAGFLAIDSDDAELLTRVDKPVSFIYDELGAANTETDNADTVFEEIKLFDVN